MRAAKSSFEEYVKLHRRIPNEAVSSIMNFQDPERLCDAIAAHLPIHIEKRQALLEVVELKDRLELLIKQLSEESDLIGIEQRLKKGRVKRQMEKVSARILS